jgi:NAD(P)-dependent dehydrogenase (short-subunit alcohol dehydrogenase family)
MPELIQAGLHGGKSRIVLVSSVLHHAAYFNDGIRLQDLSGQNWYEPVEAYGQSKLALLLFMEQLDRRLKEKHWPVTVNAMHPGMVGSSITRHFIGMCMFPWWLRWLLQRYVLGVFSCRGGVWEGGKYTGFVCMGREWRTISCVRERRNICETHAFLPFLPQPEEPAYTHWIDQLPETSN